MNYKPTKAQQFAELILALLFLLIVFMIASCNPVKYVLNNNAEFEKICAECNVQHPCYTKTEIKFKKGDTITNTITRVDTITKYDSVEKVWTKTVQKFVTKDRIIRDTVEISQPDLRLINQLNIALNNAEKKAIEDEKKLQTAEYRGDKLRDYLVGENVIIGLLIIIYFLLKSKFKLPV